MSKEKAVNYTPEMVAALESGYDPNASQAERKMQVESLAARLGKKPQQIRMKLVSMGVYVKNVYVKKGASETKEELATNLADMLDVNPERYESLAKGNKTALVSLIGEIGDLQDRIAELEAIIEAGAALEEMSE